MVTINTNLSSLLVQLNLSKSTFSLNEAIERMTTGYKINHAKDNAAGYSIARNLVCKLSSYDVATENISMGMDMVTTAQDTISLMQKHGERIQNLITQAQNGTYGQASLDAINSEVAARIAEIDRIYNSTEYNGINLLHGAASSPFLLLSRNLATEPTTQLNDATQTLQENLQPKSNGFMEDIETVNPDIVVTNAADLEYAINNNDVIGIANANVLAELAKIVNGTDGYTAKNCSGKTIVLTSDINLSGYQSAEGWVPIGTSTNMFRGTFDGQGHKIENLKIDRAGTNYQGLFGYVYQATLKNVGISNVEIKGGTYVGALAGRAANTSVSNFYVTGNITAKQFIGGVIGSVNNTEISNSYSKTAIKSTIENQYSSEAAGMVGYASSSAFENCFFEGSVEGTSWVGGLTADFIGGTINNCYVTGNISGSNNNHIGGLVSTADSSIQDVKIKNVFTSVTLSSNALSAGLIVGSICYGRSGYQNAVFSIEDAYYVPQSTIKSIGMANYLNGGTYNLDALYDLSQYLANTVAIITPTDEQEPINETKNITLQVGINGDSSSQISFNCGFSYDLSSIITNGAEDGGSYDVINNFLSMLSDKATSLGAISNRLESALESASVAMNNLTSSLSTIRDADVAKESSNYIKAQILQQASVTLLATANQSPSIALQLL